MKSPPLTSDHSKSSNRQFSPSKKEVHLNEIKLQSPASISSLSEEQLLLEGRKLIEQIREECEKKIFSDPRDEKQKTEFNRIRREREAAFLNNLSQEYQAIFQKAKIKFETKSFEVLSPEEEELFERVREDFEKNTIIPVSSHKKLSYEEIRMGFEKEFLKGLPQKNKLSYQTALERKKINKAIVELCFYYRVYIANAIIPCFVTACVNSTPLSTDHDPSHPSKDHPRVCFEEDGIMIRVDGFSNIYTKPGNKDSKNKYFVERELNFLITDIHEKKPSILKYTFLLSMPIAGGIIGGYYTDTPPALIACALLLFCTLCAGLFRHVRASKLESNAISAITRLWNLERSKPIASDHMIVVMPPQPMSSL